MSSALSKLQAEVAELLGEEGRDLVQALEPFEHWQTAFILAMRIVVKRAAAMGEIEDRLAALENRVGKTSAGQTLEERVDALEEHTRIQ